MMIQEAGYDPDLIDWAGIDQEIVGRMAEELVRGLLGDIPRKNVEAITLMFLGPKAVRCQQNFLNRYEWDKELMQ